jgi:hypothetical protein
MKRTEREMACINLEVWRIALFSGKGQDSLIGLIGSEQEGSMADYNVCKHCRDRMRVYGR